MDHKVELGLKGIWKNMDIIFKEIVEENREIQKLKQKIQDDPSKNNVQVKMEVSGLVQEALAKKKEKEAERFIDILRRISFDCKLNKTIADEMFMNAAFLVDRGREKEFDNIMDDLGDEYQDRIKFMYAGPLPVFNFVNITIYPEEWEK
jgi:hypothetical protein